MLMMQKRGITNPGMIWLCLGQNQIISTLKYDEVSY